MARRHGALPDDDMPILTGEDSDTVDLAIDEEMSPGLRVCLACGASGSTRSQCDHTEVAHFLTSSPALRAAVTRLRAAAAERRQAERALRALFASEHEQGRAELEQRESPAGATPPHFWTAPSEAPSSPRAESGPCPRCAEAARNAILVATTPHSRKVRRSRTPPSQAAFFFAEEPGLPANPSPTGTREGAFSCNEPRRTDSTKIGSHSSSPEEISASDAISVEAPETSVSDHPPRDRERAHAGETRSTMQPRDRRARARPSSA